MIKSSRSPIYARELPPSQAGMTIGLYGGSFNPPHQGHRHVATMALKRLQLDHIWCLVTPGNPLKDVSKLPDIDDRLISTAKIMDHPAIAVSGIEQNINTRFTAETLDWILARAPATRFIWIMGADNLRYFHKWQRWQHIFHQIPIAIIDRPGYSLSSLSSPAAIHFAGRRLAEARAARLAWTKSPAWTLLHGPRSELSSTSLRRKAGQVK